jgi:hypothetical protein
MTQHIDQLGSHHASSSPASPAEDKPSRRNILAAYKQMLISLFVATLAVIAGLLALILPFFYRYYFKHQQDAIEPSILAVVAFSGSLGAFFSALIRLYNFQDLPKALVERELGRLPPWHLLVYSIVPALVGAISAAALYMLFASELIRGDLFPSFKCKPNEPCTSFGMLIGNWAPDLAKDYAKAIVWGFIAGFAERLVPNTLQGLSKSVPDKDDGSRA